VSSIAFGYLVGYSGNYNLPFVPMVVTLSIGCGAVAQARPTHQVFEETTVMAPLP
jgi:hypothetical protein